MPGVAVIIGEQTALTDAAGRYRIVNLATGPYEPTAFRWDKGRVADARYRGDLLVRPGTSVLRATACVPMLARYGLMPCNGRGLGPGLDVRTISG